MALLKKLTESFSVNKSNQADEGRDQVLRETKKKTRLMSDEAWIKNKPSDEPQQMSTDVNYGKSVLSRVKSNEALNSDSSKTSGLKSTTKADTIDGRRSAWVINAGRNKVVLSRFRSEEFLDRDNSSTTDLSTTQRSSTLGRPTRYRTVLFVSSSEPTHGLDNKVVISRYRSKEVLNSDKGSTDIFSPTNKYSSLERKTRTPSYKTEELPKMTIITSDTKTESPTSKGQLSRPSPDGQVTTQEKSPTKPILKWGSQKEETPRSSYTPKSSTLERNTSKTPAKAESESLIDLTPTTESTSKGSDFISKVGSKSLIDLSITPQPSKTKSPVATPTTPVRTSSLIDLSPSSPAESKRNSGEWDNTSYSITTSTKTSFDPTSRKSRNSGNWDESSSYTTTSTKSTFNPRNSSGDWDEVNSYTTTSTKTSFNPRGSSSNEDWDNTNSHTTTNTKTTYDTSSRSTSENALPKDEPYETPTSYTKSSRTFSSNSLKDKSPIVKPDLSESRSSYKENSPPSENLIEDGDSYQSPSYSKIRNSSSSLSDGKSPAKVISLTTAFTSAEQRSSDKNKCSQCYKPIEHGARMILEDLNINCHAACFKCQICHTSLENLSAGDNFWVHQRVVHCERCYDNVQAQLSY
ncbi:sciellin isoform X2 [Chiloscyllium plagiosum]|uniref:sciellin isoform X2 n=1 Tax=Chiloscyllium plagiosum TaxID=36176 RepID=UPI001CB80336|nr:sciellin isoform X2 [Chiloscyllium plagiosum]